VATKQDDSGQEGSLSGFLGTIERVGNAVPHPAIIFLILIGIVIVLSASSGFSGRRSPTMAMT
jgi:aminobenzoyl-glutamate transport protein